MAQTTKISWTDATWNIAADCTKVDADCKFCYMYRDSMNETRYNPKTVRKTKTVFNNPLKWKEPLRIFTSSLTDFFHEGCDDFRDEAWEVIKKCPQHTFQILTKRPERIHNHLPDFWEEIKDRVWLGTSVGSQKGIDRVDELLSSGANCLYFLSIEPLYEEVEIPFHEKLYRLERYSIEMGTFFSDAIKWVIVGGESGNENGLYKYRPCKLEWIEKIVKDCNEYKIPVFVKQLGTHLSKEMKLKDRHGSDITEFSTHLQIQKFPL